MTVRAGITIAAGAARIAGPGRTLAAIEVAHERELAEARIDHRIARLADLGTRAAKTGRGIADAGGLAGRAAVRQDRARLADRRRVEARRAIVTHAVVAEAPREARADATIGRAHAGLGRGSAPRGGPASELSLAGLAFRRKRDARPMTARVDETTLPSRTLDVPTLAPRLDERRFARVLEIVGRPESARVLPRVVAERTLAPEDTRERAEAIDAGASRRAIDLQLPALEGLAPARAAAPVGERERGALTTERALAQRVDELARERIVGARVDRRVGRAM